MKLKTFETLSKHIKKFEKLNISAYQYCHNNNLGASQICSWIQQLKNDSGKSGISDSRKNRILKIYSETIKKNVSRTQFIDKLKSEKDSTAVNLAKKYITKEYDLVEKSQDIYNAFSEDIHFDKLPKFTNNIKINSKVSLMLHFADFHIGASVSNNSEFENEWNEEELYRRMNAVLNNIYNMNTAFDTIVINILGDMLDGFYGQTTRRDHFLSQNMSNYDQIRVYKESFIWFINELYKSNIVGKIQLYSVPGGNHDGFAMGEATKYMFLTAKTMYPNFIVNIDSEESGVSNKFYLDYEFNDRIFVITHGKDDQHMKRPLPLNLNPQAQLLINDILVNRDLYNQGKPIHIIKGDMHNDNLNSTLHYDYRTCLSLFGASDYCQSNYTANKSGVSYELFVGDQMSRGIMFIK